MAGGSIDDAVNLIVPPSHQPINTHALQSLLPQSTLQSLQHDLFRELSAIHRSDLTLCVSSHEMTLLQQHYGIPASKLLLSPFYYDAPADVTNFLTFQQRQHFCMIGKMVDCVRVCSDIVLNSD